MNFLTFVSEYEKLIKEEFQLLELNYVPYSFGSGFSAYRIKGKIIVITFDGKEGTINVSISSNHEKYPTNSLTSIYEHTINTLNENTIKEINEKINQEISN